MSAVWCFLACSAAGAAGACVASRWLSWRKGRRFRALVLDAAGLTGAPEALGLASDGAAERVIRYCVTMGERISAGSFEPICTKHAWILRRCGHWLSAHSKTSGLGGLITAEGFCEACLRLAILFAAFCALFGVVFSNELAAVGLVAGAATGFCAPRWAVRQEERVRSEEIERELPQMLEVVALGLRSGLSFDRSLRLYHEHFSTSFSHACASAQRHWDLGLRTRDEALRDLAASYDSALFERIVETIIRSLRSGSSLASQLEDASTRARVLHSARREEQIAKAPVKMMVPTGILILPAMLILVLGPILLELMEGF